MKKGMFNKNLGLFVFFVIFLAIFAVLGACKLGLEPSWKARTGVSIQLSNL